MENKIELPVDNSMFTHFVGVRFFSANRTYYFGTKDFQVNVGDKVGLYIEPDAIHIMKKSEYSGKYGDYSSYSEEIDHLNDAEEVEN